jgi:hypothetical protein
VGVAGNGSGGWTVTEAAPTAQGFFSNAHPHAGGTYRDIRVHGNILYALTTHGFTIEQDVEGLLTYNNSILRPLYPDLNGDGVLGRFEGESGLGIVGTMRTFGAEAQSFRNFTVGDIAVNTPGGDYTTGTDIGSVGLGAVSGADMLTKASGYLDGDARSDFLPDTRADVIASAAIKPGGALDGAWVGARPYYDFEAGAPASGLPAPTITETVPDSGVDLTASGAIAVTLDHFVQAGTGTVTVYNETDGAAVETFNVATRVGSEGGSVVISGTRMTLTGGAAWPADKRLSLRIPAGAVVSATYGTSLVAVTGTTYAWDTASDPSVELTTVTTGVAPAVWAPVRTITGVTVPAERLIIAAAWQHPSNPAPSVSVVGQAATLIAATPKVSLLQVAMYQVDHAGGSGDVAFTFANQQPSLKYAIWGCGDATVQGHETFEAGGANPSVFPISLNTSAGQAVVGVHACHATSGGSSFTGPLSGWDQIDGSYGEVAPPAAFASASGLTAGTPTDFELRYSEVFRVRHAIAVLLG